MKSQPRVRLYFEKKFDSRPVFQCIPGKRCPLPIKVLNDYNIEMKQLIHVIVSHENISAIKLHHSTVHLLDQKKIILLGAPGNECLLKLSLVHTNDERELQIYCIVHQDICTLLKLHLVSVL